MKVKTLTVNMKVKEAASDLRVTARTLYNWRDDKLIRMIPLPNGRYLVPRSEVERILATGLGTELIAELSL